MKIDLISENKPHTNRELYEKQVELLKQFRAKNAITQAQFEKSFHDLTEKMKLD